MPIYEYECTDCSHAFEELILSMSKEVQVECPSCKSKIVRKKISLFGTTANDAGGSLSSAACTTST